MENIFYFAQVFGTLQGVCIALFVVSLLGLLFSEGAYFCSMDFRNKYSDYTEEDHINSGKWAKRLIPIVLLCSLGCIFIPSKKTYLFMVGGKVIDNAITNNPEIEKLPANTLNLLNEYIKAKTEDIKQH